MHPLNSERLEMHTKFKVGMVKKELKVMKILFKTKVKFSSKEHVVIFKNRKT